MGQSEHGNSGSKGGGGSESGGGGGTKTGMGIDVRHAYALVIGIGEYDNGHWSIPVASRDARAIHQVLVDPQRCKYPAGKNVQVVLDGEATVEKLREQLAWLSEKAKHDPEATVLVYYSGHGWTQGGEYFLVTHETEPYDIAGTAFRASEFTAALRDIQPRRLLVMLDTCHAEHMAEAKDGIARAGRFLPPNFEDRPLDAEQAAPLFEIRSKSVSPSPHEEKSRGRAVLTSCAGEQKSWFYPERELSIFTEHVIEALEGRGTRSDEEFVRVTDVVHWVGTKVEESARALGREQTPIHKMEGMNFAVAINRQHQRVRPVEEGVAAPIDSAADSSKVTLTHHGTGDIKSAGRDFNQAEAVTVGTLNMGNKG